MRLVVDTTIIFSLFKNVESFREFITVHEIELHAPDKLITELQKNSRRICELSGLSQNSFENILSKLPKLISLTVVSKEEINKLEGKMTDPDDLPFLALAYKLQAPIWSEDKHFKKQSLVKSYTFDELKEVFR